jgi:hypothetical protein
MSFKWDFSASATLERPEREGEARSQEIKADVAQYRFEKESQFLTLPMCKTWYWNSAKEVWVEVPEGQSAPLGSDLAYS